LARPVNVIVQGSDNKIWRSDAVAVKVVDLGVDVVLCSEFPLRLFSAVVTVSNVIFRRGLAKPVTGTMPAVPSSAAVKTTPKRVTLK